MEMDKREGLKDIDETDPPANPDYALDKLSAEQKLLIPICQSIFSQNSSIEEVISFLRREGCSIYHSSCILTVMQMDGMPDAMLLIDESETWKDHQEVSSKILTEFSEIVNQDDFWELLREDGFEVIRNQDDVTQ